MQTILPDNILFTDMLLYGIIVNTETLPSNILLLTHVIVADIMLTIETKVAGVILGKQVSWLVQNMMFTLAILIGETFVVTHALTTYSHNTILTR